MQIPCPICRFAECRRSRRHSLVDYFLSVGGVLPWRCEKCESRFYARPIPWRHLFYAHCRICGNLELQRISPEYVPGQFSILGRILRLPALRCDPCRNKFFTIRPLSRGGREVTAAAAEQAGSK